MKLRRVGGWACGLVLMLAAGCVPSLGGWDADALVEAEPRLAEIPGQRIGDMTPYPALDGERLVLVACRFSSAAPIRISAGGPGWRADWAEVAIRAVARAVPGLDLVIDEGPEQPAAPEASIEIVSVDDRRAEEPVGLGDTLTECDVSATGSPTEAGAPSVRGQLTRSVIRMRSDVPGNPWRVEAVEAEEWIGALMHELGHALGHAGHPAFGDSMVLLEESRLRAFGRRALADEPVPAPNLRALYSIEPGRRLGEVEVSEAGREWLRAVLALVAARDARLGVGTGPRASAGDRAARLRWHWPGGLELELRFPAWREELRAGRPITLEPSASTRRGVERAR